MTTPSKELPNNILVLNTALARNEPLLITEDELDLVQTGIDFTYGATTESFSSCSVTWHGRMLIFGGKGEYRQISEVTKHREQCLLKRVGELPFDFTMGACAESHGELFLCFDSQTPYACYR